MRILLAIIAALRAQPFTKGQKALTAIAVILVVLMTLNPEVAAFGFLFDAAVLDVVILLITIQLQLFGDQLSVVTASMLGRAKKLFTKSERGIGGPSDGA